MASWWLLLVLSAVASLPYCLPCWEKWRRKGDWCESRLVLFIITPCIGTHSCSLSASLVSEYLQFDKLLDRCVNECR